MSMPNNRPIPTHSVIDSPQMIGSTITSGHGGGSSVEDCNRLDDTISLAIARTGPRSNETRLPEKSSMTPSTLVRHANE